jgi:8-oxo-dGTP diphosphatase
MTRLAASVVIVQDGQVLLHRKKRSGIWSLPGGQVNGESVAEAAVREAWEETGLVVELQRLIGVFSRGDDLHGVVFAARPVGGALQVDDDETVELRYFDPHALPASLPPEMALQIEATMAGVGGGMVWSAGSPWPYAAERVETVPAQSLRD